MDNKKLKQELELTRNNLDKAMDLIDRLDVFVQKSLNLNKLILKVNKRLIRQTKNYFKTSILLMFAWFCMGIFFGMEIYKIAAG